MPVNHELLTKLAVDVLANARANRSAQRLAHGYLRARADAVLAARINAETISALQRSRDDASAALARERSMRSAAG